MFILHCAPITNKSIHGLCRSVSSLAKGQHSNNNKVGIITLKDSISTVPSYIYWKNLGKKNLIHSIFNDPFKKLIAEEGIPDILNFHDIYNIKQLILLFHAIRNRFKIYITPRGAFSPVALQRSKIKKLIFINIFIRPLIKYIEGFVALNNNEKKYIQNLFLKKTIIISNGINDNRKIFKKNIKFYKKKNIENKINIGFVGRFDVHIKGLDTLLSAYVEYQKISNSRKINLIFLGDHRSKKNEYNSKLYFKSIRDKLVEPSKFKCIPPIYSDEKFDEISQFDLLIQPSRTEGMPNTVLEAMSIGIPCCVSPETNMGEIIEEAQSGWVINRSLDEIKFFLLNIENYEKDKLHKMGINGMTYAYKYLLWDKIGKIKYT